LRRVEAVLFGNVRGDVDGWEKGDTHLACGVGGSKTIANGIGGNKTIAKFQSIQR